MDVVHSKGGAAVLVKWIDSSAVILGSTFVGKGNEDEVDRYYKKNNCSVKVKRREVVPVLQQIDVRHRQVGLPY